MFALRTAYAVIMMMTSSVGVRPSGWRPLQKFRKVSQEEARRCTQSGRRLQSRRALPISVGSTATSALALLAGLLAMDKKHRVMIIMLPATIPLAPAVAILDERSSRHSPTPWRDDRCERPSLLLLRLLLLLLLSLCVDITRPTLLQSTWI